jgi:hydrogenase maturation protein HypF
MAIAQLLALYGEEEVLKLPLAMVRRIGERNVRLISRLVEHKLNTPPTSSAGRLFDAVAALVGVPGSRRTTYEGQAAVEMELAADGPVSRGYPFRLRPEGEKWVVEIRETVAGVVEDLLSGREAGEVSSRFHRTMAEMVVAGCEEIREAGGVSAVALSGGTFQNLLLMEQVVELLAGKGFAVYRHRRVPTNDGGLSLGQAVLADRAFKGEKAQSG